MELTQIVPIEYVSELFESNMKIGRKTIYNFHIKIAYDHLIELFKTTQTVCKSGFIREIIYKVLDRLLLKFRLEIVGYKKTKWLCRWVASPRRMCFYTPNMMISWINSKMISEEEVIQSQLNSELDYNKQNLKYADFHPDLETVKLLFEKTTSYDTKHNIISTILDHKWNIFENCHLHRPIKQITLL